MVVDVYGRCVATQFQSVKAINVDALFTPRTTPLMQALSELKGQATAMNEKSNWVVSLSITNHHSDIYVQHEHSNATRGYHDQQLSFLFCVSAIERRSGGLTNDLPAWMGLLNCCWYNNCGQPDSHSYQTRCRSVRVASKHRKLTRM